jgi:hypothetical protein
VSEALATSILDHILDTILRRRWPRPTPTSPPCTCATPHRPYEERVKLVGPSTCPRCRPRPSHLVERFDRGQPVVSHGEAPAASSPAPGLGNGRAASFLACRCRSAPR